MTQVFKGVMLKMAGVVDETGTMLTAEVLENLKKQIEIGNMPPLEQFGAVLQDGVKPWQQGKAKLKAVNPRIEGNRLFVDVEVVDGAIADGPEGDQHYAAELRIRNLLNHRDDFSIGTKEGGA